MNVILVWTVSVALSILFAYLWGWMLWGKIFQKAGYSRSKGLTMILPVINLVILVAVSYTHLIVRAASSRIPAIPITPVRSAAGRLRAGDIAGRIAGQI